MRHLICLLAFSISVQSFGQAKLRRMPNNLNLPGRNTLAPFISFDGNHLLFLTDYTEDKSFTLMYSQRVAGTWKDASELPRNVNNSRLNYVYGFALDTEATRLLLTSGRSGGVGNFDIWYSDRRGNSWTEPQNFGRPLNSSENDGCPSLTPDGSYIYFMRCEQMNTGNASACRIMEAKSKIGNTWEEPVELPAIINTGNSQCPRIMADGETLIFSSDKMPGAKGMDLYMTKKTAKGWSNPIALDFANTLNDDIHISASATGRYMLKGISSERNTELYELLFPEDKRPAWVMRVDGKVLDHQGKPADVNINIFNALDNRRIGTAKLNEEGSFYVYFKEGEFYDISVEPKNGSHTYYSAKYDLGKMEGPSFDKFEAVIKPVYPGDTILANPIVFIPYSHVISQSPELEMRRLSRFMLSNANYNFEVGAYQYNYQQDSTLSNPDFTEIIIDTVYYEKEVFVDSLNRSVILDSIAIAYTYHNDRSVKQARSVVNLLIQHGVPEESLRYEGYREEYDELLLENSPVIKIRVLKKIID